MASGNMDFIGIVANTITDSFYFLNKLITGDNDYKHTIDIIYKRNNICIKTLESRVSVNEYPMFVKKEGSVLYYKMPIGMSYKQIEKIHDVFESSLKAEVKLMELKDYTDVHLSITITEKTA